MNKNIYIQNGVNGEKILFDKIIELQDYAVDYLRTDYKNIRFYNPENNELLKHYIINNQGIKTFLFEIPYEELNLREDKKTIINNIESYYNSLVGLELDTIELKPLTGLTGVYNYCNIHFNNGYKIIIENNGMRLIKDNSTNTLTSTWEGNHKIDISYYAKINPNFVPVVTSVQAGTNGSNLEDFFNNNNYIKINSFNDGRKKFNIIVDDEFEAIEEYGDVHESFGNIFNSFKWEKNEVSFTLFIGDNYIHYNDGYLTLFSNDDTFIDNSYIYLESIDLEYLKNTFGNYFSNYIFKGISIWTEVPYNYSECILVTDENPELNLEVLIMPKTYECDGDSSIFSDYYDYKKVDKHPQMPGIIGNHDGEQILYCSGCDNDSFTGLPLSKPLLYTELLSIQRASPVNNRRWVKGVQDKKPTPTKKIEIGTDTGSPSIWLIGEDINGSLQGDASEYTEIGEEWKISRTFYGINKITHYEDVNNLLNKATRTVPITDEYKVFTENRWSGASLGTSAHLFMQNPFQSTGEILKINNLEIINYENPGYGSWSLIENNHIRYNFDYDILSKEVEINFNDIEFESYNDLTGIMLVFDRKKTGGTDKWDKKVILKINGQTSTNKSKTIKYGENLETIVYGNVNDDWGLDLTSSLFTDIKVDLQITGKDNRDSSCIIDIYNPRIIIYYKYYDFEDYPIFSKYSSNEKFYQKIDIINGQKTWIREPYRETGVNLKIKMPDYLPNNVNVHTSFKYPESSSWYKQHWTGLTSENINDEMIFGINDNMNLINNDFNLYSERIVKNNNKIDNSVGQSDEKHENIYNDFVIKYLQNDMIVQSKNGIIKRNKEV